MAYAISAWFDAKTEHIIREVWQQLADQGVSSEFNIKYRPHITLVLCENIDMNSVITGLSHLASRIAPIPLQLSYVGVFNNKPDVVFYVPTVTMELLLLQKEVCNLVSDNQNYAHYAPGTWNPHCSLAVCHSPDSVARSIEICGNRNLPVVGTIENLGIIETPAEIELQSFLLKIIEP